MKDICCWVFLLVLYYWLVNVDLDLNTTTEDQILKSNLAAVDQFDQLGTPGILRSVLLEDH